MASTLIAQADGGEGELHIPAQDEIEFESVGGDHTEPEEHLIEGTEAHGEELHTEVFPPFDATSFPAQLLWLAISFAALYFLMSRIALPRIGDILEVRRDRIEGDLAEADRLRQKTDQAIASYEEALANARSKAHEIAEENRTQVKADLDGKRAKVESDLAKKMAAAESRITEAKTEALGHVDAIAAETAQALVAQLTGKVPVKAARDAVAKVTKE